MAESTWDTREMPILEAVADAEAAGADATNDTIAEATGLEDREIQRGLLALYEAQYLTGIEAAAEELCYLINIRLLERGRREVRQWPAENAVDRFVEALSERIEETTDPEERSRLEKLREGALSIGRDVLVAVLTKVATGGVGL